jgi:hypothetical protein
MRFKDKLWNKLGQVEALQFDGKNQKQVKDFIGSNGDVTYDGFCVISTPEGTRQVSIGGWITKNTKGEFYVFDDYVFHKIYGEI